MKSFSALTLQAVLACVCVAVCAPAQTTSQTPVFMTGQAAHLIIGQTNFTNGNYGASSTLLGSPSGIAYANGVLWVVDSNRLGATPDNNRVLRYTDVNTYPSLTDLPDILGSTCGVCRGAASLVLGQPDFNTFTSGLTANSLRNPTGIATDGTVLAIADTDNNRVLIWLHLPTVNGQPADVVVGQPNFTSNAPLPPSQTSLRAPSGVWINNGRLFVADTYDDRVLIYNKIPTTNNAPADLVLGQTSFTAFVQPDLTQQTAVVTASSMQTPVAVTTDGTRLFVADLGENRVMVWNTIPTTNGAPANYVIGQPDLVSGVTNNAATVNSTAVDADMNPTDVTPVLCQSNSSDSVTGTLLYPQRCAATLSFPRFPYSDGTRLFIADGGNDRVLVFNHFPTGNGASADVIIGQPDQYSDNTGDNPDGSDAFENPSAIAFDGTSIYVTDTYNRRVLVHTPGIPNIPLNAVNNAASLAIYAVGTITFGGSITANNVITIKIGCTGSPPDCTVSTASYAHTVVAADTITTVIQDLVQKINAKDTNVTAAFDASISEMVLTAKIPGAPGGNITYSSTTSSGATILGTTAGTTLNIYLENPAQVAPGTLIQISGANLCDSNGSADFSQTYLPFTMNNCILYVDGVKAALLYVSPTQINAEMPVEFSDRTSVSLYLRTAHADGSVTATTPIATTIVPQNPGIFAGTGNDPRPGILYHASSQAFDIMDINGIIQAGDTVTLGIGPNATTDTNGTVSVTTGSTAVTGSGTDWTSVDVGGRISLGTVMYTIASVASNTSLTLTSAFTGTTASSLSYTILYGGNFYSYTVTAADAATDALATTTQALAKVVNSGSDPYVYAVVGNEYNRIIFYAYQAGPAGENISIISEDTTTDANVNSTTNPNAAGVQISSSVYNPLTCCDNPAGLPVTLENPAIPGEALYTFVTGLGPTNPANIASGFIYRGGNDNPPAVPVDSILCQGLTATPMNVTLVPDTVGVYYVEFALGGGETSDAKSQLTIAQQLFISNVVTVPVAIPGTTLFAPTITSLSPPGGPLAGGNNVTINGTNLSSASDVTFGGVEATTFTVNSATSITATVPAGAALGSVSVIITTSSGSNSANLLYSYFATPVITSITPNTSPLAGGATVTITGSGFTGATSVTFASVNATTFTVVSDTTITAVVPAVLVPVLGQVQVTSYGGSATAPFTYTSTTTKERPRSITERPRTEPGPTAK